MSMDSVMSNFEGEDSADNLEENVEPKIEDNMNDDPHDEDATDSVVITEEDGTTSATIIQKTEPSINGTEKGNQSLEISSQSDNKVSNVEDCINNNGKCIASESDDAQVLHTLQKDAFLTFWALCKLAMKSSSNSGEEVNRFALIIRWFCWRCVSA